MWSVSNKRPSTYSRRVSVLFVLPLVAFCSYTSLSGFLNLQPKASVVVSGLRSENASGLFHHDVITLDFDPGRNKSLADCDDLFVGTLAATFNLSSIFWSNYKSFDEAVKQSNINALTGMRYIAGFIYRSPPRTCAWLQSSKRMIPRALHFSRL
jgi:hypothetical protein